MQLTTISGLYLRMMEAARQGSEAYLSEYINSFDQIVPADTPCEDAAIREVYCASSADASDAIKLSLLYNDISIVDIDVNEESTIVLLNSENYKASGGIKVNLPLTETQIIKSIGEGKVNFGLMLPSSEYDEQFYSDLAPLIKSGKIIIRPKRFIMYDAGAKTNDGGRMWHTYNTDPFTPLSLWTRNENIADTSTNRTFTNDVIKKSNKKLKNIELYKDITLPYIKNISLTEYSNIIENERDNIVNFRIGMKEYINLYNTNEINIDQFRKDVIDPKLAIIQRDFEKITRASNIRMGGLILGSAIMGAATFATSGAAAAIVAVAGTAGFIGGAKELGDRSEKIDSLRENPLHLIWKLKRNK